MHPGSPVRIVSQGAQGEKPIPAVVSSIFPSANPDTHTAIVEAIVSNPDRSLLPGGFATMTITRAVHGDSLIVPAGSVISEDGQNSVWIARGAAQMYQAVICHSIYTAEEAKRDHYICPMDHGALVPMRTPDSDRGLKAYEVEVRTGASDGVSTEVASSDIAPGDRVVVHGMAGLVEGASVVNVGWGPNGPESFPSAAAANSGRVVYRCDKCGMTFSAADAKRDHYIDPMDGGKLVAVVPAHAGGA
jgi:multidrug efflux pump subunit AcrA (membrane-fusion protein)